MDIALINWPALGLGVVLAYGLGMLWFSPKLFGPAWAAGSHNIHPPTSPPVLAMAVQLIATVALALVVGFTETRGDIITALFAILAVSLFVAGMDLFSQKAGKAVLIDAGYILVGGALMIVAHALL